MRQKLKSSFHAIFVTVTMLTFCLVLRRGHVSALPPGSYLVYSIEMVGSSRRAPYLEMEAVAEILKHDPRLKLVLAVGNLTAGYVDARCYIGSGGGEIRVVVQDANSSYYTVQYTLALRNATLVCHPSAEGLSLLRGVDWLRGDRHLLARLEVFNVTRMLYVSTLDNGVYDEGGALLGEWLFWLPSSALAQNYTLILAHVTPARTTINSTLEGAGLCTLVGVNLTRTTTGAGYEVGGMEIPPTSLVSGYTVPYGVALIRYECSDEGSVGRLLSLLRSYYSSMPPEFRIHAAGSSIVVNYTAVSLFNSSGVDRKPWRLARRVEAWNLTGLACSRTNVNPVVELGGRLFVVAPFSNVQLVWERSTGVLVEASQSALYGDIPESAEAIAALSEYMGLEGGDTLYITYGLDGYVRLRLTETNVIRPPRYLGGPGEADIRAEILLTLAALAALALAAGVFRRGRRG